MTLSIERARSRRPITWLTLLGVLLLPALVGGVLVLALQNPTERLDSMTAAVVNLDEPVTIDDQYTPLGRQLAAGLVEGSDEFDSNISWVISNEDDAAEGLADGTYQAVITIPETFSADATSAGTVLADGEGDAEQAKITVTTPPDGRVADDLITQQIAAVAASTMGDLISEATVGNVLVGFNTIGDQIGEAADGADKLTDGAEAAADGAGEIPDGAAQLADGADGLSSGATQLSSGASQLSDGLGTISSKTREAASGATQLGQGLTSGADQLVAQGLVPDQLFAAAKGSAQATAGVSNGVDATAAGIDQLVALCGTRTPGLDPVGDQVCAGLSGVQAGMPQLQQGASLAEQAAAGTSAGLTQFDKQAPAAVAAQLREAGTGATKLGSGLQQLASGVDQSADGADELASGAARLGDGASQLGDGATALGDGATTLADGLDELASGTGELADGLHTASSALPSFSEDESTSLASVIANPVASESGSPNLFGPTAIPLLAGVVLWVGSLASFIALRAVPGGVLTSRRSSAGLALRSFWPAAALGAGQGILVALIVQLVAGYDQATWWGFAGVAALAGVAFAAVNQALVALFGGAGRWISAVIGVLALATGLISTVPGWLAGLGAAIPTAPAVAGLIEPSGAAVTGLIVWGILSLGATTLAVALRRSTSTKAVLAAA